MCGIYGSTLPYPEETVVQKLKRTGFRGPDQMGIETIDHDSKMITFGHNRLSIIDLDPRSNQPFTYEHLHIVFNGEIFNFKSLRKKLIGLGYRFRTESDTEVICALYLEYGKACVHQLNGMFAFTILDKKENILFGARDRLGQKPFYYYHRAKEFEFASQISSISLGRKDLSISRETLQDYLIWGYVPEPQSIYNGIQKLLPGYLFMFSLDTGKFSQEKYWDINIDQTEVFDDYTLAKENLEEILLDAVKIRLFADVPVGVFLSGGIDSSLVAALATKTTSKKINTFSVKFDSKGFDESGFAQKVANHLGTNHHTIVCDYKEGLDLIEKLPEFYDEPFSDSSAIPSLLLSKYTKQHVTVALSGDGGDESFLGYHRYDWLSKLEKLYTVPYPLIGLGAKVLELYPHYKAKVMADVLKYSKLEDAYLSTMLPMKSNWFDLKKEQLEFENKKYLYHKSKPLLQRLGDFDTKTYLNWDINTKVDRASMAYSLEVRSPLMDYRAVELANKMPVNYKYMRGNQKRILKDILYKHVPKEYFDRPKAGFEIPFKLWFRNELKELILEELSRENIKDIPFLDNNKVQKLIEQHMDGSWNHYSVIWKLLVLKNWLKSNNHPIS